MSVLAYLVAIAISLPLFILAAECLLALLPKRSIDLGERLRCAVLIPAHNEEYGIELTIQNVLSELGAEDRIVVVADNCSDRTEEIARNAGVEVVVRDDPVRRGKGFALEAGVRYLKNNLATSPPQLVIILDADCTFTPGSLDVLARVTGQDGNPRQAKYLMHAPPGSGPGKRVSAFAFLTKNLIRPRGLDRLGFSVPLTGSGMAFPWSIIKEIELGTAEIVEDLELGLQLVMEGRGPRLCEAACVESEFPQSDSAAMEQRQRWEQGYIRQMFQKLPSLFKCAAKGSFQAFASGLDLLVPPLSLLVMTAAIGAAVLTAYYFVTRDLMPLALLLSGCSLASMGLATAWYRFGRETVPFTAFLWIPAYATRKLAIYLGVPLGSNREWKRTQRGRVETP